MWASAAAGFGGHSPSPKGSAGNTKICDQSPSRRSGNYPASNWDFNDVQSLKNEYAGERYINRSQVLKKQIKIMLDQEMEEINQMELIDNLKRLGLSYHFEKEIYSILERIYNRHPINHVPYQRGLYATALEFRLLRQYGFHVSPEIFDCHKDENGDFKSSLCEDAKGMLYLYEASYLQIENESNLDMAREFTAKHLTKQLDEGLIDQELVPLMKHALELPLHWRVERLEARWFIDVYEKRLDMNPTLLELAKLDFNIVQSTHQNDLKYASSWWKSTGLAEKLKFARDRLVESFFWTLGTFSDPQQGYCRRMMTKIIAFVTIIDDVYDIYGTLDELQLFTDAIQRWDINGMDQLPDYMRLCYFTLYNSVNQMGQDALKEQGVYVIPYLRKAWADLCRAYLKEAKWYMSGYVPTLEEYLENGCTSITTPVILVHAYVVASNPIKEEDLENLQKHHSIARSLGMIVRLLDDFGTSPEEMKRGDVPKSIQCYMMETGASEDTACAHLKLLISDIWKEMNKDYCLTNSQFSPTLVRIAMNFARMGHCVYEHGDGHGHQDATTRDRILGLLFEPICLP